MKLVLLMKRNEGMCHQETCRKKIVYGCGVFTMKRDVLRNAVEVYEVGEKIWDVKGG